MGIVEKPAFKSSSFTDKVIELMFTLCLAAVFLIPTVIVLIWWAMMWYGWVMR